jgi:hypothetical protein
MRMVIRPSFPPWARAHLRRKDCILRIRMSHARLTSRMRVRSAGTASPHTCGSLATCCADRNGRLLLSADSPKVTVLPSTAAAAALSLVAGASDSSNVACAAPQPPRSGQSARRSCSRGNETRQPLVTGEAHAVAPHRSTNERSRRRRLTASWAPRGQTRAVRRPQLRRPAVSLRRSLCGRPAQRWH